MAPTVTYIENGINIIDERKKSEKNTNFPYEIKTVDGKTNEDLLNVFKGERTGFVQVGPKKWFFPSGYEREAANYYNFEFKPDDVIVLTFPRSGTTWTQEMVWLLANNLDYDTAKKYVLDERFPFLEFSAFVHKDVKEEMLYDNREDSVKYNKIQQIDYPGWKRLSQFQKRRFIKTHLPFSLLPPNILDVGCKVIYVARNPKDVAVSFYHLNKSFRTQGYIGDFPTYWSYFERNLQPWTPFWEHIKEAWERKHRKNMLFMFYEETNRNLRGSLEEVSRFLGKNYTNELYENLEEHLKIENFKQNSSVNCQYLKELKVLKEHNFVRSGRTGGWRNYFDDELSARADEWIRKNIDNSNIEFPKDFFK